MKAKSRHILLVEDSLADARLIQEYFRKSNKEFVLHHVDRIGNALELLANENIDLVLLNLTLPDSDGLETVRRMCAALPQLPIIVLAGVEDDVLALEAVQQGSQDYLVKDQINHQILLRACRHAIQHKQMQKQLEFSATHDPLTNLPNRALLQDRLAHAMQRSLRQKNGQTGKWEIAVVMLDLDDFKAVNDAFGHAVGDLLLQAVSERLQNSIRGSDTVGRTEGDEFTVIFENITGQHDYTILAGKIMEVFDLPFEVGDQVVTVTASVGISLYPQDGVEYEALAKKANIALYAAKQAHNTFRCYTGQEGK